MNSRRGAVFFWIAQVLLLPAWLCFAATIGLRAGVASTILLKVGLACGLVQVPCVAFAVLLALASAMGGLLPKNRLLVLYFELALSATMITLVFAWRAVYRR